MLYKKSFQRPEVTIVTPVFNEEKCLKTYKNRIENILFLNDEVDYKVLFVDDGSTDSSWKIIKEFCIESPKFQALRLSRNFGPHIALSAGFHNARGDGVATLPCDLQDPPEVVLEFVQKWKKGAQVVWGKRATRQDALWRSYASHIFFFFLQRYALPKESKFTSGSFFLIDRCVVDSFNLYKEHSRITFALVAWAGFDQDVVYYERKERIAGSSKWTFSLMVKALYDALLSFSDLPAKISSLIGVFICISNLFFSIYLFISYLQTHILPGWTGIMFFISTLFGIQFLILGVIMEYLRRIHIESTNRPIYFINEKIGNFEASQAIDSYLKEYG